MSVQYLVYIDVSWSYIGSLAFNILKLSVNYMPSVTQRDVTSVDVLTQI